MKKRTKQLIKRVGSGTLAVMLSVTLNINPLATIFEVVAESGIVDKFGNLKNNLLYMATNHNAEEVYAYDEMSPNTDNIDAVIRTISDSTRSNPSLSTPFPETSEELLNAILGQMEQSNSVDYSGVLEEIRDITDDIEANTYSTNTNLRSGFRATVSALMGDNNSIHADIKAMHGMIEEHFGIVEEQLSHISEQLDMINDNIDSMQHNYRVAHLYSLNAEFSNSLWRPYTNEVPYVEDFAQVMGQFANVYTGYWDTSITEMDRPGTSKAERALEILGYDAIVRYEGVVLTNETQENSPIENRTRDYRVSILGDSISTYESTIPAEWLFFYPQEDVDEAGETWWSKAIGEMGFTMCANSSYSGSFVTPHEGTDSLTYGANDTRINALVGGDGSEPDVVIVYLGINDLLVGVDDMDLFKQHYGEMIHKIQSKFPNCYTFCCTLTPVAEDENGETILNIGTEEKPVTYETYNEAIRDVAVAYQCPVIDFSSAWEMSENPQNFIDGNVHPNEEGMNKMASKAVSGIKSANVLGKTESAGQTSVMNKPKGQSGQHEGYDITGTQSPTALAVLVQEFIPEENITWLDAVTVLYKALDQKLYTYQTFMTQNQRITPETSPAYAGFSNIVPDAQGYYNGYDFYMFLNRSNTISGTSENYTVESIYWKKALNEQFVTRKTDMNSPITGSEFYILATKMMQAYGEPVINQDEIKALLQVYGSQYPVTLGFEVADAWAYLKVRGCLNVDIVPSGYMTRDELLDICMCIADKDSRSDYKNIDIVLDIGDLLRDNGYYPVYDLDFSVGAFSAVDEIDYGQLNTYTYLIAKQDGWKLGETGMLRVYQEPNLNSREVVGASCRASTLQVGEDEFYVITLPNGKDPELPKRPAYIAMVNAISNTVIAGDISWIEIPVSEQIGGIFLGGYTKSSNDTVVVDSSDMFRKSFDYRLADEELIRFNDAERSGEKHNMYRASTASNSTIKEKMVVFFDELFESNTAYAAELDINIRQEERDAANPWELTDINGNEVVINDTPTIGSIGCTHILFSNEESRIKYKEVNSLKESISGSLSSEIPIQFKDQSGNDLDCKIRISDTRETLFLSRLAYATSYLGIKNVLGSSTSDGGNRTMYDFADVAFNGADSGYDSSGSLSWDLQGRMLVDSNNSGEINLIWNGAEQRIKQYDRISILFYTLGVLPMDQCIKPTKGQIRVDFDNSGCVSKVGVRRELEDDMLRILSNSRMVDDKAATAIKKYNAQVVSKGGESGQDGGFYITSNSIQGMADLIGACAMSDVNTLEKNIASSAVMNRERQIMLSWHDMLAANIVYPTTDGGQPKKREDGAYYFMTRYGQVIVNDDKHTIQVGTTIYDLSYKQSNGSSPKLVYIDNEQAGEMYFDVRCVMGMLTTSFTRNNTKTMALRRTIGQGEYTTYELSNEGWNSNAVEIEHILCYNFPEISENDFAVNCPGRDSACTVDILKCSTLDGVPYNDSNGEEIVYWGGTQESIRYMLTSFHPTANWITVIDDDGAEFKASLFVYYPRVIFDGGGFANEFGETLSTVSCPTDWNTRWSDLSNKLSEASAIKNNENKNVKDMLLSYYDIDDLDNVNQSDWWKLMTIDAIADLYLMTGKYYISPNYVVREFNITDNTVTFTEAWMQYPDSDNGKVVEGVYPDGSISSGNKTWYWEDGGNQTGAIYWLEGIGFVYNMPSCEQFTLQKYLDGEYPLPLAYDKDNKYKVNGGLIDYNMNYYGLSVNKDGTDGDAVPYGYVLSDLGYIHYTHSKKEKKILISIDDLPTSEDDPVNGEKLLPFKMPEEIGGLVVAPIGIYYTFGGNAIYSTKVSSINQYNTKVNEFYYGNSRISLNTAQSQDSVSTFNFVSTLYNPIALNSTLEFHRVWQGRTNEAYIATVGGFERAAADDIGRVMEEDWLPNGLSDWFAGLGSTDLITAIDKGSSMLILFAFYVLPVIGIILMTILVGLSFLGDNKVVQYIVSKTFDPIRILTWGNKNIHTWKWNKVLFPCILLYISFALFLRGNIIRIIMYLANWYDSVMQWARAVF